ncbi:MAG: hypothetical protein KH313_03790 [Lachnospiraceae bacterium]|nr:hypothetical protein [Lachnospiraceae bacterium]
MATLTKEMKIFSYQTSPVVGWEGEYGGFSLELFGNGNLRYCTYKLFDDIQLMQMFKVDRDTVYGIYELIQETKEEIGEIPRNLDNGSHEGWINEFHFIGQEKIVARNIKTSLPKLTMFTKRSYYEKYRENMANENSVLRIFHEICRMLRTQGVRLSLGQCKIDQDFKLKVTW